MSRVLIIGPLPPAVGGIATIMGTLRQEFAPAKDISFINSSKPESLAGRVLRPIVLAGKILMKSFDLRGGRVLIFSSAYWSFWEKCFWIFLCRLGGAHVVLEMVDGNFPRFYSTLSPASRRLSAYFMRHVEILAAQSERWQMYYRDIFPKANIRVVSAGIDTDFFVPPVKKRENDPVRVVYIGWLLKEKGIEDLVNAARILDGMAVQFQLRLIGPILPDDRNRIMGRINEFGICSKVKIIDPITSRDLILREYQSADIFAFPSHFEGFPFALLEAISSGLPCVGTVVGGIPDILDEGDCGILVEKESPEELAEALRRLIYAPELRTELGKRARIRAENEYALAKSFESYRRLLYIEREGKERLWH